MFDKAKLLIHIHNLKSCVESLEAENYRKELLVDLYKKGIESERAVNGNLRRELSLQKRIQNISSSRRPTKTNRRRRTPRRINY